MVKLTETWRSTTRVRIVVWQATATATCRRLRRRDDVRSADGPERLTGRMSACAESAISRIAVSRVLRDRDSRSTSGTSVIESRRLRLPGFRFDVRARPSDTRTRAMASHGQRSSSTSCCSRSSSQGASDLHITVGQPPVFRLHGRMRQAGDQGARRRRHGGADEEHHARPLPDRSCRRSAAPTSASPSATLARFRVSIFKQRGNIGDGAAADSQQVADDGAAGPAAGLRKL